MRYIEFDPPLQGDALQAVQNMCDANRAAGWGANALTDRAAWLAERKSYLGANDISAILGLNPYSSPLSVYCDKLGIVAPQEETHAMRRGLRLESYVAQLASERLRMPVQKWVGVMPHPAKRHLAVNPDYWCPGWQGEGDSERADQSFGTQLVECKTHLPWLAHYYGEPGTDQAPQWELVQAQWQMHLTGIPVCHIAVLLGLAEEDFRIYTVRHDPEIGGMLEEAGDRFWQEHILPQKPPPPGGSNADSEILKRLYPESREVIAVATAEINDACRALRLARLEKKQIEQIEQDAENRIKAFMGDAGFLETDLGRFSWRTSKGSPAWKAIAEALQPSPGLIAQHTPQTGPRKFLTPFRGDK